MLFISWEKEAANEMYTSIGPQGECLPGKKGGGYGETAKAPLRDGKKFVIESLPALRTSTKAPSCVLVRCGAWWLHGPRSWSETGNCKDEKISNLQRSEF